MVERSAHLICLSKRSELEKLLFLLTSTIIEVNINKFPTELFPLFLLPKALENLFPHENCCNFIVAQIIMMGNDELFLLQLLGRERNVYCILSKTFTMFQASAQKSAARKTEK